MPIIEPMNPADALQLKKALFGNQDITELPQYKHADARAEYLRGKIYNFNMTLVRDPKIKWWDLFGKITWAMGKKAIRSKIVPDFERVHGMYIKARALPINQMVNIADLEFDKLIHYYSKFIRSNNVIFKVKDDKYVK